MATKLEFLDPVAAVGAVSERYTNRLDWSGAENVGLLANSFPESRRFLGFLQEEVAANVPSHVGFSVYDKGRVANASIPLTQLEDGLRDTLLERCSAIVTAYGH